MRKINVTKFRQNLPGYLDAVRKGEPIQITQRGEVVARLVPEQDVAKEARQQLERWRATAQVGDVLSPVADPWEVEHGRV